MPQLRQVPIEEATQLLNLSRSTIQRRLKDRSLTGRKLRGKWFIDIPEMPTTAQDDAAKELRAMVTQLEEQRADLTRQLEEQRASLTEQVTQLRLELVETRARLDGLTAERDLLRTQAEDTARRLDDATQQVSSLTMTVFQMTAQRALPAPGRRRPWWRFWARDEEAEGEG